METALKIYAAMAKVSAAIGAIAKSSKNVQQGYSFRGIDSVLNACHGPLTENGIFITTDVSDLAREERATKTGGVLTYTTLKMKTTFWAEDGSSVATNTAGEAMDSGDKSTNKAMSAALKYAFLQTFTIPLEVIEDADATTHELAPRFDDARSAAKPRQKIKREGPPPQDLTATAQKPTPKQSAAAAIHNAKTEAELADVIAQVDRSEKLGAADKTEMLALAQGIHDQKFGAKKEAPSNGATVAKGPVFQKAIDAMDAAATAGDYKEFSKCLFRVDGHPDLSKDEKAALKKYGAEVQERSFTEQHA